MKILRWFRPDEMEVDDAFSRRDFLGGLLRAGVALGSVSLFTLMVPAEARAQEECTCEQCCVACDCCPDPECDYHLDGLCAEAPCWPASCVEEVCQCCDCWEEPHHTGFCCQAFLIDPD